MALVNMKDMLTHAYRHQYAIGAFDLINLDFLDGILAAGENCQAPIILSLAESHFEYFDFDTIMPAVEAAAKRTSIPVAIHLDHGHNLESAIQAINLGCNSVMVDASHNDFDSNIATTKAIVDMAHSCGIPVEGELGYVPGVEGEDADRHPGEVAYTTVDQAKAYVEKTAIDCLAVSIGTVHGRMQDEPRLDFERLQQINETLQLPLVIHGGTGLSDEQFHKLITNGVTKINYYTAVADAAASSIRSLCTGSGSLNHLLSGVKEAIRQECERCIRLWGSEGKAKALLEYATAWNPVEHLIIYNVKDIANEGVYEMMKEGKRVLSAIPGVRHVITGEAVNNDAQYQFTWLVRFCHPAVIDSYRTHPSHEAFANNLFRPIADNRISIDYQSID